MTKTREEAIEAGIKVEETQHNMKRRKPWHDYHHKGTYMLTLVVDGRLPILGRLIMPADNRSAYVELTELGKAICNEETKKIPHFYKMVEVWKVCIMPDHIHMIVRVKENFPDGKHLGDVVRGFKVHSAYTDKEYEDYKQKWLACGERGGVLVSAAIATREKEVMREAMNRGYRIILVRENGFPPLYKPAGESFYACSEGRLLQVSPWEYHMQRRTISREQCLMLNRLVETITQQHK